MSPWKIVPLIAALAGLLWFLAPQRAIVPNEKSVLGLYAFQVQVSIPGTAKGMVMSAAFLMTLPVIAIFFFAQRYFLRGVTLTGMKASVESAVSASPFVRPAWAIRGGQPRKLSGLQNEGNAVVAGDAVPGREEGISEADFACSRPL